MIAQQGIGLRLSFLFFGLGLLLSFVAVDWTIGSIPVRALFILAALIFTVLSAPVIAIATIRESKATGLIILAFAGLGLLVSLVNGSGMLAISRQLVEIHLQALVCLFVACVLLRCFGAQRVVLVFLSVWFLSAIIACLQFLGFDFAWATRAALGDLMDDPAITRSFYDAKQRALGLSFTPVHLATQTCLAFTAFCALRIFQTDGKTIKQLDMPLIIGLAAAAMICIISGNRSPLVGLATFLFIYLCRVVPRQMTIMLPVAVILIIATPVLLAQLDAAGMRIASINDGSAIGRSTLSYYGLMLFADHPLGYGLLFESVDHAQVYTHDVIHMNNPGIISTFSLHNYYLQMLNKYGLFLFALIPFLIPVKKRHWVGWFIFLPYLIHIAFHNDGPLSSDFLFWFIFPLVAAALSHDEKQKCPNRLPAEAPQKLTMAQT